MKLYEALKHDNGLLLFYDYEQEEVERVLNTRDDLLIDFIIKNNEDDYISSIKTAMRKDVDIIYIDKLETVGAAKMALRAANCGMLVIAGLKSKNLEDAKKEISTWSESEFYLKEMILGIIESGNEDLEKYINLCASEYKDLLPLSDINSIIETLTKEDYQAIDDALNLHVKEGTFNEYECRKAFRLHQRIELLRHKDEFYNLVEKKKETLEKLSILAKPFNINLDFDFDYIDEYLICNNQKICVTSNSFEATKREFMGYLYYHECYRYLDKDIADLIKAHWMKGE